MNRTKKSQKEKIRERDKEKKTKNKKLFTLAKSRPLDGLM